MIGGSPIIPEGSGGQSASVVAGSISRAPIVSGTVDFSLIATLLADHRPGLNSSSLSGDEYRAQLKKAAVEMFPGKVVSMPDAPTGRGTFGEVYRFEVDGEAYRLKVAAFELLETCRGLSHEELASGNLPELSVELKGLQKNHPRLPKLIGVISDRPREGEPGYVLGLVTRWEEGQQLSDALRCGLITKGEAKIELAEMLDSFVRSNIYYLDLPRLDNFIVRTHSATNGAQLARTELVAVDIGLWSERTDSSDKEFLKYAREICEQAIDGIPL